MDTTVSGIGAVVVAELRAAGYMESTVGQYAKSIKALTEFASGRGYSTSLGAEFASMTTSVRTGRFSLHRRFDYRRLVTTEGDGWDCSENVLWSDHRADVISRRRGCSSADSQALTVSDRI